MTDNARPDKCPACGETRHEESKTGGLLYFKCGATYVLETGPWVNFCEAGWMSAVALRELNVIPSPAPAQKERER